MPTQLADHKGLTHGRGTQDTPPDWLWEDTIVRECGSLELRLPFQLGRLGTRLYR